jgi:hypothetical protein
MGGGVLFQLQTLAQRRFPMEILLVLGIGVYVGYRIWAPK